MTKKPKRVTKLKPVRKYQTVEDHTISTIRHYLRQAKKGEVTDVVFLARDHTNTYSLFSVQHHTQILGMLEFTKDDIKEDSNHYSSGY